MAPAFVGVALFVRRVAVLHALYRGPGYDPMFGMYGVQVVQALAGVIIVICIILIIYLLVQDDSG